MGRTKDKQVKFRVTEAELQQLKKMVKKSKISQQEYLLRSALEKDIIVIDNIKELLGELKKIGNNLNQLTRAVNNGEVPGVGEVEKMNKDLQIVWNEVIGALRRVNN